MEIRREPFVSSKDFLKSARDLGIGVLDGMCEIIDNALDADATKIWINIMEKEEKTFRFIFIDNGQGIPLEHTDDQGHVHQGIPYVLTYGGRIPNPSRPQPIGKFGFGLSQTASCLSTRTEVYSKTKHDLNWRYSYYDFDELLDNACELPDETLRQPPWLELPDTGTIVVMDNVDRADYTTGNGMVAMLLRNLGRIYRWALNRGVSIAISHNKKEHLIKMNDPLVQNEHSEEVKHLGGPSIDYGEVVLTFDHENPMGEIIDPATNEPAQCRIQFRRLSVETVRTALDLPLVGNLGGGGNKKMARWGISPKKQGFSVMRNGREIRDGETLGVFTHHHEYNYFRAEVGFTEALDDLFNVRTNKSRFSIDNEFRKYLKEQIGDKVDQIKADYKAEIKRLNAKKDRPAVPMAEVIAADVKHMLPKPRISDEARELGRQKEAEIFKAIKTEVRTTQRAKVAEAQAAFESAQNAGDAAAIAKAESDLKVVHDRAVKEIEDVERRFQFDSNCRKFTDVVGTGGLFELKSRGDNAHIIINTATEFYNRVYSLAEKDADLEGLLDLMIFAIAYSEHVDNFEQKPNWEHIRREISAQAEIFVGSMADLVSGGEA